MVPITALDLEEWARTYTAKFEFPRLVRRLIRESCRGIRKLEMPGGELAYLSGFDGILDCSQGNPYVPSGLSAWELGTKEDVTTKANQDYEKRKGSSPFNWTQSDVGFVFATPRRWATCTEWENQKNSDKRWKNVSGVWSNHMESWIDDVPWAAASFARDILRKPIDGLSTIDMIWSDYADVPHHKGEQLHHDFVLGERNQTGDALMRWLTSVREEDRLLRFSGPTEREITHFIAAVLHSHSRQHSRFEDLSTRVLIIDKQESTQLIRRVTPDHTVLAKANAITAAIRLSKNTGCKVIVVHRVNPQVTIPPLPLVPCIVLQPMVKEVMIRSIIQFGYSPGDAFQLCQEGSFDYEQVRMTAFLC